MRGLTAIWAAGLEILPAAQKVASEMSSRIGAVTARRRAA